MENRITPRLFLLFAFIFCFFLPSISSSSELTIGIANSTCAAMKQAGKIFTEKTNIKINYLCQPSGLLAQGIKEGALDVDYFLSANEKWMNDVVEAGLVDPASIKKSWGNQLVVASLPLKGGELKLQTLADLTRSEVKQILMGDPKVAPYGKYASEALVNEGLWEKIQSKLKYNRKIGLSIRNLKKYGLSRKGVVAILYQTSVKGNLLAHFVVPQPLYTPISYFSAPLISSQQKSELAQFLTFICSEEVDDIFSSAGFMIYPEGPK